MSDQSKDSDTPDPSEEGRSTASTPKDPKTVSHANGSSGHFIQWLKSVIKGKNDTSLRETIEEYIDAAESRNSEITSVSVHERALISNILKLKDYTVVDAMIPRADIFALEINTSQEELLSQLAEKQHSRIPIYRETLDDVIGTIHIKDILSCLAQGKPVAIDDLVRDVPIVSPAMHVLDLLLMMKQMRKHMALVVDEFGGIDGLVTINDVIESIVGEMEDEYDQGEEPIIIENPDGSVLVDARFDLEEFEEKYGLLLDEEEREDHDTLGGLVFEIAGRVPARGEILAHHSGMIFEIVDADPRRVNRLLIKNIPLSDTGQSH